jgi:hypothetical protein
MIPNMSNWQYLKHFWSVQVIHFSYATLAENLFLEEILALTSQDALVTGKEKYLNS